MVNSDLIKQLRDETLAPFIDCKRVLEQTNGDISKAKDILKKEGLLRAQNKLTSQTKAGIIEAYIHAGAKVGVLLDLRSETDFVAMNSEFKALAHDIAMHIAAMNPTYVKSEDMPAEELEKLKNIYREQQADSKKPAEVIEKIIEGRMQKEYEALCLLKQPFIKDESETIENKIKLAIAKFGENIEVKRFIRFEID